MELSVHSRSGVTVSGGNNLFVTLLQRSLNLCRKEFVSLEKTSLCRQENRKSQTSSISKVAVSRGRGGVGVSIHQKKKYKWLQFQCKIFPSYETGFILNFVVLKNAVMLRQVTRDTKRGVNYLQTSLTRRNGKFRMPFGVGRHTLTEKKISYW